MCRYARGVDRSDWEAVRAAYHPDAYDDHGEYKGDVEGLIAWLEPRFAEAENRMHVLGNCLIDFAGPDLALVETMFVTQRLRAASASETGSAASGDAICRQSWGRYVDRFERRNGAWRVAHRTVVLDSVVTLPVQSAARIGPPIWGRRDAGDRLYEAQAEILGSADRLTSGPAKS